MSDGLHLAALEVGDLDRSPALGGADLPDTKSSFTDALKAGPEEAAGAVLAAEAGGLRDLRRTIVREAVIRSDAHLVKYVLACMDSAAIYPPAERLFHAAAAYLLAIWIRETPEEELDLPPLSGPRS